MSRGGCWPPITLRPRSPVWRYRRLRRVSAPVTLDARSSLPGPDRGRPSPQASHCPKPRTGLECGQATPLQLLAPPSTPIHDSCHSTHLQVVAGACAVDAGARAGLRAESRLTAGVRARGMYVRLEQGGGGGVGGRAERNRLYAHNTPGVSERVGDGPRCVGVEGCRVVACGRGRGRG